MQQVAAKNTAAQHIRYHLYSGRTWDSFRGTTGIAGLFACKQRWNVGSTQQRHLHTHMLPVFTYALQCLTMRRPFPPDNTTCHAMNGCCVSNTPCARLGTT